MAKMISIAGTIMNTVGTLFTLWTVFMTKNSMVGTAWEFDHRSEQFPKEKRRIIVGFIFIVLGNILQCIGVYVS